MLEIRTDVWSADGAAFYILAPEGTTKNEISEAKSFIYRTHDVAHLVVVRKQEEIKWVREHKDKLDLGDEMLLYQPVLEYETPEGKVEIKTGRILYATAKEAEKEASKFLHAVQRHTNKVKRVIKATCNILEYTPTAVTTKTDVSNIIFKNDKWLVFPMSSSEVAIHNSDGISQTALLNVSIDGKPLRVLYDFPERIPKYIKTEIAKYFERQVLYASKA